jgi:PTS system fructose-specific IIA component/PTS system nitrogen regulatory IIA component
MPLAQFVVRAAIRPALAGTTREQVVREMVQSLVEASAIAESDREDVVKAVLRRESLGSTGIGKNIAIPHSRHAAATQLVGTVGVSSLGIPFDSLDGEPVHIFVLLVSPQDRPADHLRALENVVKAMNVDAFVDALKAANSVDEIWDVLQNQPAG